jgi:hypothetical protein
MIPSGFHGSGGMLEQSGVFCLGLLEEGQVGIGVLTELKKINDHAVHSSL